MNIANKRGIKIGDYSHSTVYKTLWANETEHELDEWYGYLDAEYGSLSFCRLDMCPIKDQVKTFNRL